MRAPSQACVAQEHAAAKCGPRRICSSTELAKAMQAVANGDEAAFASVYAATAAKLFGIIMRILRRREVAEEVLHVYLRIWQHAHTFDARYGSPITWMVTIARHRALDEVRRKNTMIAIDECPDVLRLVGKDGSLASDEDKASQDLAAALQRLSRDKRSMLGRPIATVSRANRSRSAPDGPFPR